MHNFFKILDVSRVFIERVTIISRDSREYPQVMINSATYNGPIWFISFSKFLDNEIKIKVQMSIKKNHNTKMNLEFSKSVSSSSIRESKMVLTFFIKNLAYEKKGEKIVYISIGNVKIWRSFSDVIANKSIDFKITESSFITFCLALTIATVAL